MFSKRRLVLFLVRCQSSDIDFAWVCMYLEGSSWVVLDVTLLTSILSGWRFPVIGLADIVWLRQTACDAHCMLMHGKPVAREICVCLLCHVCSDLAPDAISCLLAQAIQYCYPVLWSSIVQLSQLDHSLMCVCLIAWKGSFHITLVIVGYLRSFLVDTYTSYTDTLTRYPTTTTVSAQYQTTATLSTLRFVWFAPHRG